MNQADSPNFFIQLETDGEPTEPLPLRNIREAAERFLRTLNPDDIVLELQHGAGLGDLPALRMEHHRCTIEIRGLPKSPEARGKQGIRPLGAYSTGAAMVDDSRATRDAAVRKAAHYGDLEHPYLVAVNAQSQHLDRIDMMEALFGKEAFYFPMDAERDSDPEMRREPNGLWTGPSGPRYTRVSAVLIASSLVPWTIASNAPWLFHNPWARRPFPRTLDVLSHARQVPKETRMAFNDGAAAADIFGLPKDWDTAD